MQDAARLAAIHAASFTVPRPWSAGEIAAMLDGTGTFLIDRDQGFLIGRAIAGEAELLTLAVRPEARRLGAGRALVSGFLSRAAAAGAETAFLEVSAENAAAIALYESSGFAVSGRRPRYYADPAGRMIDALVMSRALSAKS